MLIIKSITGGMVFANSSREVTEYICSGSFYSDHFDFLDAQDLTRYDFLNFVGRKFFRV